MPIPWNWLHHSPRMRFRLSRQNSHASCLERFVNCCLVAAGSPEVPRTLSILRAKTATLARRRYFHTDFQLQPTDFGNFWVIDLLPTSKTWGPIYFACHDAPVILYQSPGLSHFLVELFKMSIPPRKSLVDDVHEDRLFDVWRKNPGVMSYDECIKSADAELKSFATQLGPSFQIIDMRTPEIGFGFSWGRYGAKTVVRRHGNIPIFAYQKRVGILERLFKRKGES